MSLDYEIVGSPKDSKMSYRYWVNKPGDGSEAPAPQAVPKKLSQAEADGMCSATNAGSVWNTAGTWEEKNLTEWGKARIKASVIYVRNKKRVGFNFDIVLNMLGGDAMEGTLHVREACYKELDDMEVLVSIPKEKAADLDEVKLQALVREAEATMLPYVRSRLEAFSEELSER
eukprot:jgi/Mesen1/10795/ME000092S10278